MTKDSLIQQAFEVAAERYAAVGVDVRKALEDMKKISLSLHCWQADDVSGFENQGGSLTGGIQVTGTGKEYIVSAIFLSWVLPETV